MSTACVVDNGLFVDLAVALQNHFDKVYYATPWECSMPKSNQVLVGMGLVERIESIWNHIDEIDTFVFPDLYQGPLQKHLEEMGKDVWGSKAAEGLEIWRISAKELMSKIGIDIGPYEVVEGSEDLRKYLKANKDRFIKVSKTRGDFETFHHEDFGQTEPWLDDLEFRLGPKKKFMKFILETPIEPAIEVGFDGYCIDGKFSTPIVGIEVKDCAFLGKVSPLPTVVEDINNKLAPLFKQERYRNFFSSEVRIKGSKGYMLDPCCRMPSPPGEIYPIWMKNLGRIIEQGAKGKYVEPDFAGDYGAALILKSEWSNEKWQAIDIPSDLRSQVSLRARVKTEGKDYVVPGFGVGAIVSVNDSAEKAIQECKDIAGEIKGYGLEYHTESLDKALEEFDKIKLPSQKPKEAPVVAKDSLAYALSGKGKSLSDALSEALK